MLDSYDQIQGHPVLGYSWEGFVVEQVFSSVPSGWEVFFYRTASGVEIDLILIKPGKGPIAVEIKYSSTPKPEKGFKIAFDNLKCRKAYIIYPGSESYPLGKNIHSLTVEMISEIFK